MEQFDVIIAGGGFAGLVCAEVLASCGISVCLLERKAKAGVGMHTTGIIVKEAAAGWNIPDALIRKITEVRLYAPSLRHTDLHSPDYFFLATDTPAFMQWLSTRAEQAGATLRYDTSYTHSHEENGRYILPDLGLSCRYLIGADGPRSKVADDYQLGQNREFLLGAEVEFSGLQFENPNAFYCYLDQKLAPGYLGWVVPGVNVTQVGLATRMPARPDSDAFVKHVGASFGMEKAQIVARRGGLIPVGGLVQPFSRGNVMLLGDAAGIVSPLTAGGIHTAMHFGKILGESLAAHLQSGAEHPAQVLARAYPRFHVKRAMRFAYERFAPNWLLDAMLGAPPFRMLAQTVFFRPKTLRDAA